MKFRKALHQHLRPRVAGLFLGATGLCVCLQAGAASALQFYFSFTGTSSLSADPAVVTGLVSGLLDNQSDQISGITVKILSATNTPPIAWPVFDDSLYSDGAGFDVVNGAVTGVDIIYELYNPNILLALGNQGYLNPFIIHQAPPVPFSIDDPDSSASNSLVFQLVPGPLPVMGAAAAWGWSRRLRRSLKARA